MRIAQFASRYLPRRSRPQSGNSTPFLITFSGIDGAGKSTQIEYVSSYLEKQGLRILRLSFWDHVAVLSQLRSDVGSRAASYYRADQPHEMPFEPRNNKHIRKWYLTTARAGLYIFDTVRLRRLLKNQQICNSDVILFDRYVYDQIANLYSRSSLARAYIRFLSKRIPCPDLAFILDTSPAEAFARKPEYPLEFMYRNRLAFLRLREFFPELITISAAGVDDVKEEILTHIRQSRLGKLQVGEKTDVA